ncbi:hypothetical protein CPB83DRAFT_903978 [Crepidotus variabilis]|uniref:Uncharacterized protein n=1 Tax=Crepidotus variabilis TaxID=179855 RepID=A0A9P6JT02_9AGAR|nr:hypothetical protein CPB83DRAFT_903978 [Crepidotus variabilis]
MATPFGYEEDSYAHQSALNSDDESIGSTKPRTRRQSPQDSIDEVTWDLNEDGRPKTRRVNPQRLAVRLGPELVAEMEAYIVPGAKMPSFTIRKDFQERYSVDRRHIYDYFHSRGLRVAKEDKHTNLIRGRALKAQALAEAQSDLTDPRSVISSPKSPVHAAKRTVRSVARTPAYMRSAISARSKRQRSEDLALPDSCSENTLSENAFGTGSSGADTDWEESSTSPQFTLPSESSEENYEETNAMSDFLAPPSDFVENFLESPQISQSPCSPSLESPLETVGPFLHLDQDRLLSCGERSELYDLISGSMSPTLGSEYLAGKSDIFGPSGCPSTRKTGFFADAPATSLVDFSISCDSIQSWLTDDPYQPEDHIPEDYRLAYGHDDFTSCSSYDGPVISSAEKPTFV